MEGYFPFELKDSYPDGVVFSLIDKSTEVWSKGGSRPVDPKYIIIFSSRAWYARSTSFIFAQFQSV